MATIAVLILFIVLSIFVIYALFTKRLEVAAAMMVALVTLFSNQFFTRNIEIENYKKTFAVERKHEAYNKLVENLMKNFLFLVQILDSKAEEDTSVLLINATNFVNENAETITIYLKNAIYFSKDVEHSFNNVIKEQSAIMQILNNNRKMKRELSKDEIDTLIKHISTLANNINETIKIAKKELKLD
jgi:hypothetical protein